MARTLTVAAGLLTIAAAAAIYALKHDTSRIEDDIHGLVRAIERAERDIAALKAERAYLGRPERIDTLARQQGLGPIRIDQYGRLDTAGPLAEPAAAQPGSASSPGGSPR